jgi:hypothetical protein
MLPPPTAALVFELGLAAAAEPPEEAELLARLDAPEAGAEEAAEEAVFDGADAPGAVGAVAAGVLLGKLLPCVMVFVGAPEIGTTLNGISLLVSFLKMRMTSVYDWYCGSFSEVARIE